jgi:hypothetical protein
MKLKIYTEFPDANHGHGWTYATICYKLPILIYEKFKDQSDIDIEICHWDKRKDPPWQPGEPYEKFKHCKYTHAIVIIENADNGNYLVVSQWDQIYHEVKLWPDYDEKCKGLFTSHGMNKNQTTYDLGEISYTPLSFTTVQSQDEELIEYFYNKNQKENYRIVPDKLWYCAHGAYLFRNYVYNDDRFDYNKKTISPSEFTENMSQYKINMDIDCIGENSCRFIQGMGLGCVMIRPILKVKTHEPIIENFHYISVDCDDISNYELLADSYIDKFNEIKSDNSLLDFISKNARDYYLKNGTVSNFLELTAGVINIENLK